MISIVILTGGHLCHNPRVQKEATTLANHGFAVEVLGAWFDPTLRERDQELRSRGPYRFTPVVDLARDRVAKLKSRVRAKLGRLAFRAAGCENRWQMGYAEAALGRAAHSATADLYIAHSEAGLSVARDLLRARRRVGVDMEDWFSEDLPPETRLHRPVRLLHELEGDILRRGAHATCPSRAMSDALATAFECAPPTVIYNAFAWSDRIGLDGRAKDRPSRAIPSIHWYSQTLGKGRGLEDLLDSLPHITHDAEIHLRGQAASGFSEWLGDHVPLEWRNRVFVHPPVSTDDLLSRIAEHDIGFAGEMKHSRSRDLTVTNKMLHYLLAGLAVVASDTSGQEEIAREARGAVLLYPSGDAAALATQLNRFLASTELLRGAKSAALLAAERTFCWERQAPRLLESIGRALMVPACGIAAL